MTDTTLSTIYAIKHAITGYDEAVIDFWSKYTNTPAKYYGTEQLLDISISTLLDYIETADNPRYVLWCLFQYIHFDCKHLYKNEKSFDDRVRDGIWTTLALTQVKNSDGNFVNGFREMGDMS